MPAAIRSYVTAGVALVGASVISVTPVVPNLAAAQQEVRSVRMEVDLAAQSVANVVPNLINMFLNMPQANVNAVNYWAESWAKSGNWWVYSQDNILGWDRANPAMAWSMVDLLLPIPALSKPYGEAVQWWMAANLPMHQGCSGLPPCPNQTGMFNSMFRVPAWEFYTGDGYTFGPDGYTPEYEPVSANESYWGYELGEDGDKVAWYGQTVKLDPFAGWKSLINYLLDEPEKVTIPSFDESVAAWRKFGEALNIMFNPFVPQSYLWNPRYSSLAYVIRPFAKYLCPSCNKYDPFMPPDWKPSDGYPTPVDDGWQDDNAQTPTGLPLPTEDDPSDNSSNDPSAVALLVSAEKEDADVVSAEVAEVSESEQPGENATTDSLGTSGEVDASKMQPDTETGTEDASGTETDEGVDASETGNEAGPASGPTLQDQAESASLSSDTSPEEGTGLSDDPEKSEDSQGNGVETDSSSGNSEGAE